jgi:hypothetical protein
MMLDLILKASRRDKFQAVHDAADKMRPKLRKAFLLAIGLLKDQINMSDLETALAEGRIEAALRIVNVDALGDILIGKGIDPDIKSFREELRTAFGAGATVGISQLPKKAAVGISFDIFNPRAVAWAETRTALLIRQVTKATQDGVRVIITNAVETGVAPRTAARSIRELVGLTNSQAKAVTNFKNQLDSQQNLGFKAPWLRRLSAAEKAVVRRHMKKGGLSSTQINKLVNRYHQSLVNKRSLDIARTESINAVQAGQLESWRQAQDQGLLPDTVKREWLVTPDDRLREDHAAIPGMNPDGVGLDEQFQTPFGPVIGPHDSHIDLINCRCVAILTNLG